MLMDVDHDVFVFVMTMLIFDHELSSSSLVSSPPRTNQRQIQKTKALHVVIFGPDLKQVQLADTDRPELLR